MYSSTQLTSHRWLPSDTLEHPGVCVCVCVLCILLFSYSTTKDVFANYLPWLSSIAISLQGVCMCVCVCVCVCIVWFLFSFFCLAGAWEECCFRAVPLSVASILGEKIGKRKWCVGFAFVLQAVVFGGFYSFFSFLFFSFLFSLSLSLSLSLFSLSLTHIHKQLLIVIIQHNLLMHDWLNSSFHLLCLVIHTLSIDRLSSSDENQNLTSFDLSSIWFDEFNYLSFCV